VAAARLPPGPRGHILLGNLLEFRRDNLAFYTRCARDHGDVVSFRLGPHRVVQVNRPDLVEQVLVTGNRHFAKNFFALRHLHAVLGDGLITSEGGHWLRQRRLAQPAFRRDQLGAYGDVMVARTERMLAGGRPGETRDIHAEMMRLTLEIADGTSPPSQYLAGTACFASRVRAALVPGPDGHGVSVSPPCPCGPSARPTRPGSPPALRPDGDGQGDARQAHALADDEDPQHRGQVAQPAQQRPPVRGAVPADGPGPLPRSGVVRGLAGFAVGDVHGGESTTGCLTAAPPSSSPPPGPRTMPPGRACRAAAGPRPGKAGRPRGRLTSPSAGATAFPY
jgi:hypothetical protein